MADLTLAEGAAQGTPAAGEVTIYVLADGRVYAKDDAGVEVKLSNDSVPTILDRGLTLALINNTLFV